MFPNFFPPCPHTLFLWWRLTPNQRKHLQTNFASILMMNVGPTSVKKEYRGKGGRTRSDRWRDKKETWKKRNTLRSKNDRFLKRTQAKKPGSCKGLTRNEPRTRRNMAMSYSNILNGRKCSQGKKSLQLQSVIFFSSIAEIYSSALRMSVPKTHRVSKVQKLHSNSNVVGKILV